MALYAAAAAGGGTAQWLLEAANAIAGVDQRARRGPRTEEPWYQETAEREGRYGTAGGGDEESREPWSQLAASAMGLALPILLQAGRRLAARLCSRTLRIHRLHHQPSIPWERKTHATMMLEHPIAYNRT